MKTFKPSDINVGEMFSNSIWGKYWKELVAKNIVLLCLNKGDDDWISFSWEEYKKSREVTGAEKRALDDFVRAPHYLTLKDGKYTVTRTFLNAIVRYTTQLIAVTISCLHHAVTNPDGRIVYATLGTIFLIALLGILWTSIT